MAPLGDTAAAKAKVHNVVFVLGPPGSGKGTQCKRIKAKYGFVHLSAGDLLRAERQRPDSKTGELIESHIRDGTIVPVEVTCKLIENAMLQCGDAPGFLVDGFPRNQDNLDGWQNEMSEKTRVHFVLYLQAPIDVCTKRCLQRECGRSDDNRETMEKRIVTYNNQTMPIIHHYTAKNLVREVDASDDELTVFNHVCEVFANAGFEELTQTVGSGREKQPNERT